MPLLTHKIMRITNVGKNVEQILSHMGVITN